VKTAGSPAGHPALTLAHSKGATMRYKINKNTISGLVLSALGLFFMLYSMSNYRIGTLQQMGPGLFPIIMGSILFVLGMMNFLQGLSETNWGKMEFEFRSFVTIIGSIVCFGIVVPVFGVIPAVVCMLLPAVMAESRLSLLESALIILTMSVVVYIVFEVLLHMPLRLFRYPF
jgi:hypothetical protein